MSSLFQSTRNTRILPTGTMKYIRSDFPERLSNKEIQWLLENNITMIVDLRSDEEVAERPCFLQNIRGFRYVHLPVTGGNKVPKSRGHLHSAYQQMADKKMEAIVDTIMNSKTGVMYFCTAGKDRTGVVSAILLSRLGCSDKVIVDDYMESKNNLMDVLTAYANRNPEIDIEVIIPNRDNIVQLLNYIKSNLSAYRGRAMQEICLVPMTEELFHQYYKEYQNDPDLFADMNLFVPYRYSYERVEAYIRRQKEKGRLVFAVMREGLPVGEIILKEIDHIKRECTLSICLQNNSVKGQGIGTAAERLILAYATKELGIRTVYADAILKNKRSQHVLEKVGFRFVREDEAFRYYRFDTK